MHLNRSVFFIDRHPLIFYLRTFLYPNQLNLSTICTSDPQDLPLNPHFDPALSLSASLFPFFVDQTVCLSTHRILIYDVRLDIDNSWIIH